MSNPASSPLQSAGSPAGPVANPNSRPDLTLADIGRALRRRWKLVIYSVGICFLLAVIACIAMKPRYEASEQIQVQKDNSGPLGLSNIIGEGAMPSDTIDYNITLQTQAEILRSDAMAVKMVEDLGLEHTYNFQPKFSPLGFVMGLIAPKGVPDGKNVPLHDAPQRRARAIRIFGSHLKVKVADGTRLINVKYSDPDPKVAAAVVNHLAQALIEYNFQTHYQSTAAATGWINEQLTDLKKATEDSQAKVADLQKQAGVFTTGDMDMMGRPVAVSVVLSRLQDLNNSLTAAQQNRILKEAVYRAVQSGGAESISGLAGNIASGASPDVVNSLNTIQNLRAQEATVKASYAQDASKYGPDFPRMQQLQKQLDELNQAIHQEVVRIETRAKSDYDIALKNEQDTRAMYESVKQQADTLNNKAIQYTVAKQEAEQNRGLYDDLYRRVKEAGAIEGLKNSNIVVMDPGTVPGKPKWPNVPLFLMAGIVAGLFFGSALALLVDSRDNSIQALGQVERELGTYPLGVLPALSLRERRPALSGSSLSMNGNGNGHGAGSGAIGFTAARENPLYMESLRALRTSILLPLGGSVPKVLLVTSCQPGEGKTSLSLNLSAVLAQQGYKVLVVDCNMRRPGLRSLLGIKTTDGLSNIIANPQTANPITAMPEVPGVFVLGAGLTPPNAAELLGSDRMKALVEQWRHDYDFVILDAPPVLSVTDPVVLLNVSDTVLMLVRYEQTARPAMNHTYRILSGAAHGKRVGVIINGVPQGSNAYSDYYGYKIAPYEAETTGSLKNA